MTFQLDDNAAAGLTNWANGGTEPGMNAPVVSASGLQGLLAGFDAPLPPPQRIDYAAIEQQAKADMAMRFADLPQGRDYWTEALPPSAPRANQPNYTAPAPEPAVYYGAPAAGPVVPAADEPKISMASLDRVNGPSVSLGGAFNKGAAPTVLPHMTSRFGAPRNTLG